jgi:hypothetical protein
LTFGPGASSRLFDDNKPLAMHGNRANTDVDA